MFLRFLFISLGLLVCGGCVTLSPVNYADTFAASNGFAKAYISAKSFTLLSYQKFRLSQGPVRIYIEGDGHAWETKVTLSDDPTPRANFVLELAARDDIRNIAYLARPCQYVSCAKCSNLYWSDKRFSEEVIADMDQAVSEIKKAAGASGVELVGYSGGGAVALLVALRRSDVLSVRTVAGNLDHRAVSKYHGISRLEGSLNPADYAQALAKLPQIHFSGKDDKVIPLSLSEDFVRKLGNVSCAKVVQVTGASHWSGWKEQWRTLLQEKLPCKPSD